MDRASWQDFERDNATLPAAHVAKARHLADALLGGVATSAEAHRLAVDEWMALITSRRAA